MRLMARFTAVTILGMASGLGFFHPSALAAERVSVIASIEAAFAYNPSYKSTQEDSEQARHAVDKARSAYFPKVTAYGGVGVNQTNDTGTRASNDNNTFDGTADAGLRLVQPLWHGGALVAGVNTKKAQYETAAAMLEDKGISLAFEVIAAHSDLMLRQELVRLAAKNVAAHKPILASVQQRYQANIATVGELKQVEGRYARAKATLAAYESALDAAASRYRKLTGQKGENLTAVPLPKTTYTSLEGLREACLAGNMRIKAALMQVQAAQEERDAARAAFFPRFDLEAGTGFNTIDRENNRRAQSIDAGLRMTWELFSGGRDRASVAMAGAKVRQTRYNLHALMDTLNEELESTLSNFASAKMQAQEYEVARKASVVTRDDFQRQFEAAQRSLIDVLDAESDYFYASSQLAMAKTNRVVAAYRLQAITGVLLSELHVTPPRWASVPYHAPADLRTTTPSLLRQGS